MTTATLRPPAADSALASTASLLVERTGITFADVGPGRVGVEIAVRNDGELPSPPTAAVLTAAPLGAFVAWRPLALVPAPALAPGESAVLRAEARRPAVAPLGPPDRVPPRRLLTALGAEDERPARSAPPAQPRRAQWALFNGLPPDVMGLIGQQGVHWAGNLNVFIGGRAVERHVARALRVYPGLVNLALFIVGAGRDAYRFHAVGHGEDWKPTLHDATDGKTLALDVRRDRPVAEDRWVEADGPRVMVLALRPPKDAGAGAVAVHVTQRSTDQEAVVEFSLDPAAAGPGCYTV
jgi:hypothetical protein